MVDFTEMRLKTFFVKNASFNSSQKGWKGIESLQPNGVNL